MNVVLIPGILGFDRIGPLSYLNGVAAHLRAVFPDVRVLAAGTSPLGTIEHRAGKLAEQIRSATTAGTLDRAAPLHLIAHSMGGLDARYLITHIPDVAPRVAALAMLSTPHLGTPLANIGRASPIHLLANLLGSGATIVRELLARTDAVYDLSEESMHRFNADCPDSGVVRYIAVVGAGRNAPSKTSVLLTPTSLYLDRLGKRNDGIVPYESATAHYRSPIEWPGDHADLIGHNLDAPVGGAPAFDYLARYDELVRNMQHPDMRSGEQP